MEIKWDDKIELGKYTINNRICMAALTRQRCNPEDGIPNQLVVKYYTQRSGAGIMLTEATAWSQRGETFPGAACLYNEKHAQGWKKVIDSVHQRNCKIFLQIFNGGRATHQKINRGLEVRAPSAIAVRQKIRGLNIDYPVPVQMTIQQIQEEKVFFQNSVKLSKQCGFDGLQLHGAHGYLIDSFLRSCSNKRTDKYGGSAENRARFCLQLFDIALKYYQPYQLGIKISPVSRLRDMYDENPQETFGYLLQQMDKKKIGFVQIRQSTQDFPVTNLYGISPSQQIKDVCKCLKPYTKALIIANDSFTPESGMKKMKDGLADMISFGRLYVSNPDLAQRVIQGKQVNNNWDRNTFFGFQHGPKGYIDYKRFDQE